MATITLPYTITNGQDHNAVPVMADLNAIVTEVNGNLESVNIKDLAVIAVKLATDAVETLKIKDANVTAVKLATDAVETLKIKDVNVTAAKLATDSVETLKIKDLNVTTGKLAADAMTNEKIADDAVQAENVLGLTGTGTVSLDNVPEGTTRGNIVILAMTAQAPAGTYNGIGDSKVRVKEDITNVPTSGTLEIARDEYAYTAITVADKEFTLSGTLTKNYAEDDPVYIKTIIRNLTVSGNLTVSVAPCFCARPNAQQTITAATWVILNHQTEDVDVGGNFNNSTYLFTAPVAGLYLFGGAAALTGVAAGYTFRLGLYLNGVQTFFLDTVYAPAAGGNIWVHGQRMMQLAKNDTVGLWGQNGDTVSRAIYLYNVNSWFYGYRIFAGA